MENEYYNSDWWRFLRENALESANWQCERCRAGDNLHVHHKYGLGKDDLEVLCEDCHSEVHGRDVRLQKKSNCKLL